MTDKPTPANRTVPEGKRFQKGQSGNPSGRPKVIGALRDLARAHTTDALDTLVEVMKDKGNQPGARVAAAKELLDRGYGKAPQPMDGDGEGGPIKVEATWLPQSE